MSIPDPIVLLDARARYVHPAFEMSRASTKTVFDSTGKLVTVPANALGWDHDPATGQARGYLAEPGATNLLLHSNDLTQGAWVAFGASVTGDAITGPDGNGMAKLVENSADQGHSVPQNFTIGDGDTIAAHFIAKAGERVGVQLVFRQNSPGANSFTMKAYLTGDGSFDAPIASGTATAIDGGITHLGGGFYYIWLVGTLGAGITDARFSLGLLDSSGSTSYQGDGTSGLYVGYCQAEEGSCPTSYIETGAATATRAGDWLRLSRADNLPQWSAEAGTLLIDVDIPDGPTAGTFIRLGSHIYLSRVGSGLLRASGSTLDNVGTLISAEDTPGRHVVAMAWGEHQGWAAAVDGAIARSGEVVEPVAQSSSVNLMANVVGGDQPNGPLRRAVYYPQRVSNADLQSLTAIQE